jgi:hypothetical protein
MKKLAFTAIVLSLLTAPGLAQDFYVIKSGDVFSRIIQNKYPSERIYGAKGKLAEVLQNNPDIKNINLILPNKKIYFASQIAIEASSPVLAEKARLVPRKKEDPKISEQKRLEEWNISAIYGGKYLSVSQSGALGKVEFGDLFINNLGLNSDFNFKDWSFGFQFDSYKFKYKALTTRDFQQMYAVNLYGSYKWFLGGLNIEQNPLFRNNNGNIEMTKMTLMSLSVGVKKDIELPTRKPTMLKLKGWLSSPLTASSDNAEIKHNSITGHGIHGEAELNRQLIAKDKYTLHATWTSQAGAQRINQKVEWDVSVGESKSNIINASTSLGLLFKF